MAIFEKTLGAWLNLGRTDNLSSALAGSADACAAPVVSGAVLAVMSDSVSQCQALVGRLKNRDSENSESDVSLDWATAPESARKVFEALTDVSGGSANGALDAALADLINEPDCDNAHRRLESAVREWITSIPTGHGNLASHEEMVRVLSSLIRNLRESSYRELFAAHHRQTDSIGRRSNSKVDDVFVRLQSNHRRRSSDHPIEPTFLDFRGKTASTIEAALRRSGNLVILGEPRSGKSALLRHLAASCAESPATNALLPVLLRLSDLTGGEEIHIGASAAQFAADALNINMPESFFEDALVNGRCLVCLDALDEVSAGELHRVVKSVEQSARCYVDSYFIVASRIAVYEEEPLDECVLARYRILPMEADGVAAFVDTRFPDDSNRAQALRDVFDRRPGVKSNLSPVALLTLNSGPGDAGFPSNRFEFCELVLNMQVDNAGVKCGKTTPEERQTILNLLTAVARFLLDENRETINRDELRERAANLLLERRANAPVPICEDVTEAFEAAETFIGWSEERNGLFEEQRPGGGLFGFPHTIFRDYLFAKDIRDRNPKYGRNRVDCWEEIERHLTDDRWRDVILLLLGSLDGRYCTYLTEKILAASDEAVPEKPPPGIPAHLKLAADALANRATMSPELQREIVDRLVYIGKGNHPIYRSYTHAVQLLGEIRHLNELIPAALAGIATDASLSAENRYQAVWQLIGLGESELAIPILTAVVDASAISGTTHVAAAKRLASFGEQTAYLSLLTAIAGDPEYHPAGRLAAARDLGRMGDRDGAIALMTAIGEDAPTYNRDREHKWGGPLI